jgi:HTH-type transcriptional regulator/antitoxin HigA
MTNKNLYNPNIAIPPGDTLAELLESIGMTQVELANRMGMSTKHLNQIIKGEAPITAETAIKLECIFKMPASFWNNLETRYREIKARLEEAKKIEDEISVCNEVPYAEMVKLGWVKQTNKPMEKVVNLRSFFGIASLDFISRLHPVAFRTAKQDFSPEAMAAWIRQGEILSAEIDTAPFNKEKLEAIIPNILYATIDPAEFVQCVRKLLGTCGIAYVLAPHIKKTFVCGATKWINPQKAMLQQSNRGCFIDIFYFSLFHELGHILLHSKKETFIETNGLQGKEEREADEYAQKTLIPEAEYKKFVKSRIEKKSIIGFASKIGVHPCIVIGRMAHDKIIGYQDYYDLKPRFKWSNNV